MNLSDMTNYVTTQVGLTDTDDVSACELFLRNWDEQVFNSYLWKDALIGVDYQFNPQSNADNGAGIVVVPPVIDLVVAARIGSAPGVWGNSLRVHGLEDYYRVDWDWFCSQGVATQYAEMSPIWFDFYGANGLQLVNYNIADSGAACEIIWYDTNGTKHVQVAVPGSQFVEGGTNEPPVPVPAALVTVPPEALAQQIFQGNYGGVAPTFVPTGGVGIAFDTVTRRMWSYYNGAWR